MNHQQKRAGKTGAAPASRKKQPKRRRSLAVRIVTGLLSVVMCVVAAAMLYIAFALKKLQIDGQLGVDPDAASSIVSIPEDLLGPAPVIDNIRVRGDNEGVTNILLIGVDTRSDKQFTGLSDSMILVSINKWHKEIRLVSFLRDTYVQIPAYGKHKARNGKLNSAFALGGFELLAKTFEKNFALKVDKYVVINFHGLEQIIDAVGGLDVNITAAEARQIPVSKNSSRKLGGSARTEHLNGYQAVQYARIRMIDSDFVRTRRQQYVLQLLFDKLKSTDPITMHSFVSTALNYVKTNLSEGEILGYAVDGFTTYSKYALKTDYQIPTKGEYDDPNLEHVGSVLILKDPNETVLKLHKYIFE